jgi:hypothetical protein
MLGVAAAMAAAEGDDPERQLRFADPVRIEAGAKILGEGRLYPSPVLHDLDRDGTAEVLVADLFGAVTVARRGPDGLGAEAPLKKRDGKALKFHNW